MLFIVSANSGGYCIVVHNKTAITVFIIIFIKIINGCHLIGTLRWTFSQLTSDFWTPQL